MPRLLCGSQSVCHLHRPRSHLPSPCHFEIFQRLISNFPGNRSTGGKVFLNSAFCICFVVSNVDVILETRFTQVYTHCDSALPNHFRTSQYHPGLHQKLPKSCIWDIFSLLGLANKISSQPPLQIWAKYSTI